MFTFPLSIYEWVAIILLIVTFGVMINSSRGLHKYTENEVTKLWWAVDKDKHSVAAMTFFFNSMIFYDIQVYYILLSAFSAFKISRNSELTFFPVFMALYFTLYAVLPKLFQSLVANIFDSATIEDFVEIRNGTYLMYLSMIGGISALLIYNPMKGALVTMILPLMIVMDLGAAIMCPSGAHIASAGNKIIMDNIFHSRNWFIIMLIGIITLIASFAVTII